MTRESDRCGGTAQPFAAALLWWDGAYVELYLGIACHQLTQAAPLKVDAPYLPLTFYRNFPQADRLP